MSIERPVTEWDEFTGRLEAVDAVAVRPRVSGYVSAVRFTEGAVVQRGDLLFQIDPRPFQAEVDRLRAEREPLRRRCRTRRLRAAARRTAARRGRDVARGVRSPCRLRPRVKAQTAAVDAALAAAELNLEFTRVTAPITGRIGRAIVTEGNLVSSGPGEATLLTTLVSIDPIHAHFDADEGIYLKYLDLATAGPPRQRARCAARFAWRWPAKTAFRARGTSTSSTTGSTRAPAPFAAAPSSATPQAT